MDYIEIHFFYTTMANTWAVTSSIGINNPSTPEKSTNLSKENKQKKRSSNSFKIQINLIQLVRFDFLMRCFFIVLNGNARGDFGPRLIWKNPLVTFTDRQFKKDLWFSKADRARLLRVFQWPTIMYTANQVADTAKICLLIFSCLGCMQIVVELFSCATEDTTCWVFYFGTFCNLWEKIQQLNSSSFTYLWNYAVQFTKNGQGETTWQI